MTYSPDFRPSTTASFKHLDHFSPEKQFNNEAIKTTFEEFVHTRKSGFYETGILIKTETQNNIKTLTNA